MEGNNQFGKSCGCPSLMQDSRIFTNYMSATKMNEYIKNINNITDNSQYRTFLQNNGVKIMKKEQEYSNNNKLCNLNNLQKNKGLNALFPIKELNDTEGVSEDINAADLDELTVKTE
jgi:hypothetical protein